MKGAVLFGHRPYEITARQLRYTYGVALRKDFVKGNHPESKKITIENKDYCLDIFNVFITQGTLIELGHRITKSYTIGSSLGNKVFRIYCSPKTDPSYVDEKGSKLIREIDLDPLLPKTENENYSLEVTYIFGDTEIEMEIKGKNFDFCYSDIFDYKND